MQTDFLVILGLIFIFSVIGFYLGKNKSISILVSMYVGILFYEKLPFLSKVLFLKSPIGNTLNRLAIYTIIVFLIYLVLKKHISGFGENFNIIKAVFFGLAITIFIIILSYYLIPIESIYDFGDKIDKIFRIKTGLFYPILIPLAIIAFL